MHPKPCLRDIMTIDLTQSNQREILHSYSPAPRQDSAALAAATVASLPTLAIASSS